MKNSTKLLSLSTLAVAAMLTMSASPVYAKESPGRSFEQDADKSDKNNGFGNFGMSFPTAVWSAMEVDGDHVEEHPEKVAERLGKIPHVSRAMPSSSIKQGNFVQQIARANPAATPAATAAYQPAYQPAADAGGGYTSDSAVIASGNGAAGAFNYGLYYETFNRYAPGDPGAVSAAQPDVNYYVPQPPQNLVVDSWPPASDVSVSASAYFPDYQYAAPEQFGFGNYPDSWAVASAAVDSPFSNSDSAQAPYQGTEYYVEYSDQYGSGEGTTSGGSGSD